MSDWIEWSGGECPVPDGSLLAIRYRDGIEQSYYVSVTPLYWRHDNDAYDIIAYKVIEQ